VGIVPVYVILTGYGKASVGFAVAQHEKNYKDKDPYPEAYFAGSIKKASQGYGDSNYRIADKKDKAQAQKNILKLIKLSLKSLG